LNNVPIDRYVRITNAFEELVDLLGGVEVFVPERMSRLQRHQQLEIDLDPGWQTLNGNQAQQFVIPAILRWVMLPGSDNKHCWHCALALTSPAIVAQAHPESCTTRTTSAPQKCAG